MKRQSALVAGEDRNYLIIGGVYTRFRGPRSHPIQRRFNM